MKPITILLSAILYLGSLNLIAQNGEGEESDEQSYSAAYHMRFGVSALTVNHDLYDELRLHGKYTVPLATFVYEYEIQNRISKRFSLSTNFIFMNQECFKDGFESFYDRYSIGILGRYDFLRGENGSVFGTVELAYASMTHQFVNTNLDSNIFTTQSLFNFEVKGIGTHPTVELRQETFGINAGIGFEFHATPSLLVSGKGQVISTPFFPAYRYLDGNRITNLKRFHNTAAVFTFGIGFGI
jgi:hypothetical protein